MSNQICDTIFVMDPQFNVIGILSNNGAFPNAPFFDDTYIQELSTGAETYEFSTYSNAITSEILQLGNYIVFKYGNKYKLFQIMDNDDEHKESQIITCYCEMAGLELLTDYCEPFSIEGNVELFFNTVLRDTNWQLGGFSESLITKIQQVKIEKYTNVYKVIQENIETYGNIEIEFRVGFNGNAVTGFYIDVYENGYRGSKTYKRFEYGENVEGIKRNRNMYDFASAMIGTGKDGLTFKDIEWKIADGKPADKPKGQDFIVDLGANERFNKRGKYIKSLYESDDTNPQDLLLHSWERLQEVKEPKFDYEVDLALTDTEFKEISIGDTNYVIDNDYNPPILLECRVGKLEISLTDSSKNKCTLSNYKEVASKIREPVDGEDGETPQIGDNGNWWIGGFDTGKPSQGEQGLPGTDGEPAKYVRVTGEQIFKYGKGFTGTPTPSVITITSSIIGIINPKRVWSYKTPSMSDYVNMSSTDASIVIMHNDSIWGGNKSIVVRCSVGDKYDEMTLVKVADGIDGTNGLNGADGVNGKDGVSLVYKGEFTSHPANPQNGWYYRNTSEGKTFVYQGAWYQMTIDGKDGLDGNNGKDGLSIEYKGELSSPPSNPNKNWSYRDKENGIVYIYTGIAWEVMTYDGSNGQDGANGQNGLSIFVTYNDSLTPPTTPTGNGTTNGWHTNATSNAIWISQKIASSATDGTWGTPIKIKGETGPTGSGVESIAEEYYLSDSKETQTGGSWVTTPPTWSQGKYIWTRSKIVYTNPTATEYTNPICDTSWEVVNDLEIGSTNLLTKSNDFSTMSGYGGAILTKTYDVVVPEWGDKKGTRIVTSGGTDEVKAMKSNNPSMKWPSTDTYTISMWVKNNSTNTPVTIRGNGMHSFAKNDGTVNPGESKRIVITGKGNTSSYMQFNFQTATASDNLDITIGYAQIERGNKVTDWSPAPEDAIKEIDVMYYLSTSQTSLSGGSWSTKAPQWENGKYMWSKTVTKYNDGTTRESEPTCIAGAKGDSAYTIILSNENHTFPCQWNGNIPNAISTTTKVIALKGATEITPTIGTLPTVPGLTLTKNGATITVVANVGTSLADYGSFGIPVTVDGIGFTKTFTWSKSKAGTNGSNGTNGSDGISPLGATLTGQSLMKYLDKTTAPVPATIVLKCKAMKGATEVTEKCTYQWQAYYNSAWNNIGTGSSISVAYNSSYFLNLDILQIRVNVTYGTETITLEHTISKVYDNKYISQQEIFDKLIENGNEFIYTDPGTGKIYINASYIKTGQFVADLIKGGILTLGGTGDNSLGDYGYMRVLNSAGTEEVAHLDGGEMWLDTLTCGNLIAENLDVGEINNSKIPTKLDADVTVYVDEAISDEQSSNIFEEGAVFNSFQGAMDAIPTNLNSHTATIKFRTDIHENIEIRGMNGGNVYILLCKKNIYGNVYIVANSAKILMYGGMESSDSSLPYPAIKPSELVNVASRMFSVCVATSPSVFFRYCNVYGKSDSSNKDLYYAIGAVDMGTVYIGNIKVIGSDNGVRASSLGRAYVNTTEGKVNNYAFRAVSGGDIRLNNTKQIGGGTNVSIAAGSTIVYSTTGVTFDSSSSTGSNDNTTTVTKSVTLKSSLGDTYRSTVYNSWKKDNTVRQGDWGYGDCNGCWFFGSQFSELKGKTITKVVLKIKRNSGGYSASVSHVIKMHNHSSRPGGMPSYLSGWSKTVSIAVGETKTITITDSAVLNAIKGGTMKGFGLQSSYSKSNYSACSGVVSVSVTYK